MNILLNRLLTILNDEGLTSTYFHIASMFLNHLYDLGFLSVNEVADLCTVSKSTISKFVRAIGFDDYTDFKLSAIAARQEVIYNIGYNINITDYIEKQGVNDYLDVIKEDIELLKTNLNMEKVDELTKDLYEFKKVAAFGSVYSETAALDLQSKLAFNKKMVHTNLNDMKQEEYIRKAGEDTLIIVFTNSGRYLMEYQLMEGSPEKDIFTLTKAKIAVITSNQNLEKDPRVDICISFPYSSRVQNHPMIFQIISDIISVRYRKYVKKIEQENQNHTTI